jgi:hypothetical protein
MARINRHDLAHARAADILLHRALRALRIGGPWQKVAKLDINRLVTRDYGSIRLGVDPR